MTLVRRRVSRRDTVQRVDSIDQDHEDVSIILHGLDDLRPLVIDLCRVAKAVGFPNVAYLRAKSQWPGLSISVDPL